MNLSSTVNLRGLTPEQLPSREPGCRFRVLFVTVGYLGFKSLAREFELFAAKREDLEAVHVIHRTEGWMRLFQPRLPIRGPWSFATQSYTYFKRYHIRSWFGGRLDLSRFDAVHCTTQHAAWAFCDVRDRHPFALSVLMDATARNHYRDFGTPSRIPNWPLERAERRIYPRVDTIASMSNWAADSCVRDYGVPRERILFCPPVARVEARPGGWEEDRAGRRRRIIFIGNDFARKGGPELLRAHQARWVEKAELHIVSGQAKPDRSCTNVVWHGAVPRERLLGELLPTMDVFAMPTKRDMSPWVIVEAQGCGVPVVVTRVGGIGDLVADGQTGILTPPGDQEAFDAAIERLISDPAMCAAMGREAQRRVAAEFSPDIVYGRLIDRLKEDARRVRAARGLPPVPWD